MKILNILTSRLNYNGIGMSLLNYYKNINSEDIQLDYLVPNVVEKELKREFTIKGNKVFELDYAGKKMHQEKPLLYCFNLFKILKKEKYDIVHVHGSSSLMFLQLLTAKLAGVKIRIAHSRNTNADHKFFHILFKPLFNLLYTNAFSCGIEAGEWLFGKNKKFFIIPNGKDTKMFCFKKEERLRLRKQYNLEGKIVLGHVGNFNYQKNHDFLIEVFNKLSKEKDNYYLILAGEGCLKDSIKAKIIRYGLEEKVLFLGQISVNDVSKWLNAMDIMLFPSKFEGFPNVLIEWQINGLPCVISDTITRDVKITELVSFKSINFVDEWIEEIKNIEIVDRNMYKNEIIKKVREAGFDICENAKMLEKEYRFIYKKDSF